MNRFWFFSACYIAGIRFVVCARREYSKKCVKLIHANTYKSTYQGGFRGRLPPNKIAFCTDKMRILQKPSGVFV